jgi:hypothetical protein
MNSLAMRLKVGLRIGCIMLTCIVSLCFLQSAPHHARTTAYALVLIPVTAQGQGSQEHSAKPQVGMLDLNQLEIKARGIFERV